MTLLPRQSRSYTGFTFWLQIAYLRGVRGGRSLGSCEFASDFQKEITNHAGDTERTSGRRLQCRLYLKSGRCIRLDRQRVRGSVNRSAFYVCFTIQVLPDYAMYAFWLPETGLHTALDYLALVLGL